MVKKILEVNVDDLNTGGVYSFVKSMVLHNVEYKIDIASLEMFKEKSHIDEFSKYDVDVFFVGYTGLKLIKQFVIYAKLKKLILQQKYDCVHIHSDVANKMLVTSIAARNGKCKKIILHSHSSGVEGSCKILRILVHKICRYFLNFYATDYIACSEKAAKWMFNNIDDVKIINNGIETDKFKFDNDSRANERFKYGLNENDIVLGHVGRFTEVKNHTFMIDILKYLNDYYNNYKIIFVGEGPLENSIIEYAKKRRVLEKIIFYGTTDHIENVYSMMDIFLLPSLFEGYPLVGVEAQASGLPCIISNTITNSVKILESTELLPIGYDNLKQWTTAILNIKKVERIGKNYEVKKAGYDICDTVNALFVLYSSSDINP